MQDFEGGIDKAADDSDWSLVHLWRRRGSKPLTFEDVQRIVEAEMGLEYKVPEQVVDSHAFSRAIEDWCEDRRNGDGFFEIGQTERLPNDFTPEERQGVWEWICERNRKNIERAFGLETSTEPMRESTFEAWEWT